MRREVITASVYAFICGAFVVGLPRYRPNYSAIKGGKIRPNPVPCRAVDGKMGNGARGGGAT
jgi:hypothetical protein